MRSQAVLVSEPQSSPPVGASRYVHVAFLAGVEVLQQVA